MATFIRPISVPTEWRTLPVHPLAELVEFGVGISVEGLATEMQNLGYDDAEPVVVYDGQVLDGRHKRDAAFKAELEPSFAEFVGKDPIAYIRKKLLRQHLDESQRALLAAKFAELSKGRSEGSCANLHKSEMTQEMAAAAMNVSRRSVASAARVLAHAIPELRKAVERGDVKVSTAAQVATEPAEIQAKVIADSLPILCRRCKRIGKPVRNCPSCEEAKDKADRPKLKKEKTANKAPATSTKFDWNSINKAFATIRQVISDFADAHDAAGSSELKAIKGILDEVQGKMENWEQSLPKKASS